MSVKVEKVVVLGAGSAGLVAALTLKLKIPSLHVRVIASSQIGVIGVGEGTVPFVPGFIHGYLGIDEHEFFVNTDPVYKLGVRFTWGRRDYFNYTFSQQQWAWQWQELPRPSGFYADLDHHGIDLAGALMETGNALPTRGPQHPDVPPPGTMAAWHLENHRFVDWLDGRCRLAGVEFTDAELQSVEHRESGGIEALHLTNGERHAADLFIDASGFSSELLGKALGEPYRPFRDSLFCDRAVVGGWEREPGEPILPYTVSDTMDCGWSWRIDHPERINRGYVFSSDHLDPAQAEAEFLSRNPKISKTRLVSFRSGRHERMWVENVVAIGNSGAFVEPLEATAIMCLCLQCRWLVDGLIDSQNQPPPTMQRLYNRFVGNLWDEIREFLAFHYKLNTRLSNPFWRRCREETLLFHSAELIEFYRENGPSGIGKVLVDGDSPFGIEGYYAMLVGMQAPMDRPYSPSGAEASAWRRRLASFRGVAEKGMPMERCRELLRRPETWRDLRQS
jgi:tryptophan halogenase